LPYVVPGDGEQTEMRFVSRTALINFSVCYNWRQHLAELRLKKQQSNNDSAVVRDLSLCFA